MKTTVELPDELLTELKIIAARERRKLRDVMTEVVSVGLRCRQRPDVTDHEREIGARRWLDAWADLGRKIEEASADPRTCVDILLKDRR